MTFNRYALYYAPPADAAWARFCIGWLGWDMETGQSAQPPSLPALPVPLEDITDTPRKYGLHGTLKPPFRLAPGFDRNALEQACADLAAGLARVDMTGLDLARMGRFLALRPVGDETAMGNLAAACVRDLDRFRAPAPPKEVARRRQAKLSPEQDRNLMRWGYPYVMEQFRFHITLSGRLPKPVLDEVETVLSDLLVPQLPSPFAVDDIALVGEDDTGHFHLIRRFALSG
ncbi:DUF1045 domain-containing protein [Arenibacterium sp. CAU 1754]